MVASVFHFQQVDGMEDFSARVRKAERGGESKRNGKRCGQCSNDKGSGSLHSFDFPSRTHLAQGETPEALSGSFLFHACSAGKRKRMLWHLEYSDVVTENSIKGPCGMTGQDWAAEPTLASSGELHPTHMRHLHCCVCWSKSYGWRKNRRGAKL